MTSQIEQQIISLTILSKVSRSKAIHAMKFGRIIKHSRELFSSKFFQKMRPLVPDLYYLVLKSFI